MPRTVVSVAASPSHTFSKVVQPFIRLLTGLGVEGDAHCGETVKHRSRVAVDPTQINLRQVHLVEVETLDGLRARGFDLRPGDIGENVVTRGVDLRSLPRDTELALGPDAIVRVTGLRNPCTQLDDFQQGLMQAVIEPDAVGGIVRKCGVMAVVVAGGVVAPGDEIRVHVPEGASTILDRV